ncbi:hypothetical protein [Flavihumibacter petaseus]|uniref:Uncharacterized protein n=1 Tax=Flavihumibacter petaseus NBRC 106054 TaxID=1220578 RepID=A0A0E9N4T1_9BACT|nr:hypothetical protein [Flavihumibacter petaseus]GAO44686.1 hypothetical protein FPE01S_03_07250 [Flavihumibacter petaseus NBRC 106054]
MKIKKTIRLIEYAQGIPHLLFLTSIIITGWNLGWHYLTLVIPVTLSLLSALLLRYIITPRFIRKSADPALVLAVLRQLHIDVKKTTGPGKVKSGDNFQLTDPTELFLLENNLPASINTNNLSLLPVILASSFVLPGFLLGIGLIFVICLGIFGVLLAFLIKTTWSSRMESPVIFFEEEGLIYHQLRIPWTALLDWRLQWNSRYIKNHIFLIYYDNSQRQQEIAISTSNINCDRIDFLMLLNYYKEKYRRHE